MGTLFRIVEEKAHGTFVFPLSFSFYFRQQCRFGLALFLFGQLVGCSFELLASRDSGMTRQESDEDMPIAEYAQKFWGLEQGLPAAITAITQTKDGYIWYGTNHGVARFDGLRFTLYTPSPGDAYPGATVVLTAGLKSPFVKTLLADRAGGLWIGTNGGGLSRLQNGKLLEHYSTKNGLTSDRIRSLYEDDRGGIWIGTFEGALDRLFNGTVTRLREASSSGVPGIRSIVTDSSGAVWLADESGLVHFTPEHRSRYSIGVGLRSLDYYTLFPNDNALWVGTSFGLYRFENGLFTRVWPRTPVATGNSVISIARDRNGILWFGTTNGLKCLRRGKVYDYPDNRLSASFVSSVFADTDGNIWVATWGGGLNRISIKPIISYKTDQGLSANEVWDVTGNDAGGVWVATEGGVDQIINGTVRLSGALAGLPSRVVHHLRSAPDGSLWLSSAGWPGIYQLRYGRLRFYGPRQGLSGGTVVTAMALRKSGTLFVCSWNGVYAFRRGRFVLSMPIPRVTSMLEAHDGTVWLSTFKHLIRWRDGETTTLGNDEGFRYSFEDSSGTIWVGSTSAGLMSVRAERLMSFSTLGYPFNDSIFHIFEDGLGNLWFTTLHAVVRVRKSELNSYAGGHTTRVSFREFGMPDGLPSLGCNDGGWMDTAGRIWIPTGRGLAVLDPHRVRPDTVTPKPLVEQVSLDDRTVDSTDRRFPPTHRRITFQYTGIDLEVPEYLRFKYKLEGFDRVWVDGGPVREVSYTSLRPGNYSFRLIASNRDGLSKEAPSLSFAVDPPFYLTPAFFALCAVAVVTSLGGAYRWRIRFIEDRAEVALIERTRVAREIHDILLQGVAGASLMLESIAPQIEDATARRRFDGALNEMQRAMTDTRSAISNIRFADGDVNDLVSGLAGYGKPLAVNAGIDFQVAQAGRPVVFDIVTQRELLQVGREAILNAIKHSGCTKIIVGVFFGEKLLRITVSDDGRGFEIDNTDQRAHWGIIGMRERSAALGGRLSVQSAPGLGTTVEAVSPIRHRENWRLSSIWRVFRSRSTNGGKEQT